MICSLRGRHCVVRVVTIAWHTVRHLTSAFPDRARAVEAEDGDAYVVSSYISFVSYSLYSTRVPLRPVYNTRFPCQYCVIHRS